MLNKIVTVKYKYSDRKGGIRDLYPTTGKVLIVGRDEDKFMLSNVECIDGSEVTNMNPDSTFKWGRWVNTWELESITEVTKETSNAS